MAKSPALSGKALVRALMRAGFTIDRTSGSHHILKHPGPPPRSVTVPVHGNQELKRATVAGILKQAGITLEDLVDLL
nr:type II toxin-antitoxin system HicA family toxin [Aquibium microcysteis]